MRALLLAALLAPRLAGPALADGTIVLMLENASGQTIRQVALFPVGDGGQVIDDVLMSGQAEIAAGATAALDTRLLRCGPVSLWVQFADGSEANLRADLCRTGRLRAVP